MKDVQLQVNLPQLPQTVSTVPETIETEEKLTPAMRKALEWLKANPGNLEGNHRELCKLADVSASTFYRAQQKLRTA